MDEVLVGGDGHVCLHIDLAADTGEQPTGTMPRGFRYALLWTGREPEAGWRHRRRFDTVVEAGF